MARCSRLLVCIAVLSFLPVPAGADGPAVPVLTSLKPAFYVVSEATGDANTPITLGVAQSLERSSAGALNAKAPWFVPKPSWKLNDMIAQCANDPQALGGVILTYYHGYATHFFLLWQSETTTLELSASVVSCKPKPAIVGVVNELPGASGTPWVIRRTQVSIPLVTIAGYATMIASRKGNTNNVNAAALLGAIFGGTAQRDIPGYSDPVRLRAAAQHVGDDLNGAIAAMCKTHGDVPDETQRTALCGALGFGT